MKKYLILTTILCSFPFSAWADLECKVVPSCGESGLGFTKIANDCPNGYLTCPFDTSKVWCPDVAETKYEVGCFFDCNDKYEGDLIASGVGEPCSNGKYKACSCSFPFIWYGGHCVPENSVVVRPRIYIYGDSQNKSIILTVNGSSNMYGSAVDNKLYFYDSEDHASNYLHTAMSEYSSSLAPGNDVLWASAPMSSINSEFTFGFSYYPLEPGFSKVYSVYGTSGLGTGFTYHCDSKGSFNPSATVYEHWYTKPSSYPKCYVDVMLIGSTCHYDKEKITDENARNFCSKHAKESVQMVKEFDSVETDEGFSDCKSGFERYGGGAPVSNPPQQRFSASYVASLIDYSYSEDNGALEMSHLNWVSDGSEPDVHVHIKCDSVDDGAWGV